MDSGMTGERGLAGWPRLARLLTNVIPAQAGTHASISNRFCRPRL